MTISMNHAPKFGERVVTKTVKKIAYDQTIGRAAKATAMTGALGAGGATLGATVLASSASQTAGFASQSAGSSLSVPVTLQSSGSGSVAGALPPSISGAQAPTANAVLGFIAGPLNQYFGSGSAAQWTLQHPLLGGLALTWIGSMLAKGSSSSSSDSPSNK